MEADQEKDAEKDLEKSGVAVEDYYRKVLLPLQPLPLLSEALELLAQNSATRENYAKLLQKDPEMLHWIQLTIERSGYQERAKTLEQMMIILGEERLAHAFLGRCLERMVVPPSQTVSGKLIEKAQKNPPKPGPAKAAPPPSTEKPSDPSAESSPSDAKPAESAEEIIPDFRELEAYLKFSARAHLVATQIKNSYPGLAYAAGYLWDLVLNFYRFRVSTRPGLTIQDKNLRADGPFLGGLFDDGLRAAVASNTVAEKLSIPHQRFIFSSALLHNIGKPLLLAWDPQKFESLFQKINEARKDDPFAKTSPIEASIFEIDHTQAGALFLSQSRIFSEVEKAIDFHHDPHLLRFQNSKMHALSCLLRVGFRLAKLYERHRAAQPNIHLIDDQTIVKTEEFKVLKLQMSEWKWIKNEFVLILKKAQL